MPAIDVVLRNYQAARAELNKVPADNSNQAVAAVREVLPAFFRGVVDKRANANEYVVSGSVGEYPLNMATIPWVAVFKADITTSARRGFYIVLLFSEDGKAAVLSLNQGITDFLREYGSKQAERKLRDSAGFASALVPTPIGFKSGPIDLGVRSGLGSGYQKAAILSRRYEQGDLPTNDQLAADLTALLDAYDTLHRIAGRSLVSLLPPASEAAFQEAVQHTTRAPGKAEAVAEAPPTLPAGPKPKPEVIQRQGREVYSRDPKVSANALARADYRCALASEASPHLTFVSRASGRPYVEAHHFVPMSKQQHFEFSLDVEENIVSLCPHCHRLVHHGKNNERLQALSRLLAARKEGLALRGIEVDSGTLRNFYAALEDDD